MQPNNPTPYANPAPLPQPAGKKRRYVLVAIIIGVLLALGLGAWWLAAQNNDAPASTAKASMRIYYNDGKTVLWESAKEGNADLFDQKGFVGRVADQLVRAHGQKQLTTGAWRVTTTLDGALQREAVNQMQSNEAAFGQHRIATAVLVAQDVSTGHIVSWADASDNPLANEAPGTQQEVNTLALPLTYAAYMEHTGATAQTILDDQRVPLPGYPCTNVALPTAGGNCAFNFDYQYTGQLPLRQALGGVRLVPAISAGLAASEKGSGGTSSSTTTDPVWSYAEKQTDGTIGCYSDEALQQQTPCYGAATYGDGLWASPLTLLQSYATMAHNGKKTTQTALLIVTADGKEVYSSRKPKATQTMPTGVAAALTDILADPAAGIVADKTRYTANGQAVSTMPGADFDNIQTSAIQYTSQYAVGIWAAADTKGQGLAGATTSTILVPTHGWLSTAK